MDSLTQLTLGAAVSESLLGKKIGRKAALWGALLGTFPDLDVFIPMGDPVADFTYHRSFSHSLFVLAALTPLWSWLMIKAHPTLSAMQKRVWLSVYAVFFTHVILDSFTVYGTQIFWPFVTYPVSIGSIFIIDPLYTLPLILGSLMFLLFRDRRFAYQANLAGLALSTLYLLWSLGVQTHVRFTAQDTLASQKVNYQRLLVTPAPFNTLLWRIVAVNEDGYYVTYHSLLDSKPIEHASFIPSHYYLLNRIQDHPPVQRLQWFSHGFIAVEEVEDKVVVSDIRMGIEPSYVFNFAVARMEQAKLIPINPERVNPPRDLGRLSLILKRVFNETVDLRL